MSAHEEDGGQVCGECGATFDVHEFLGGPCVTSITAECVSDEEKDRFNEAMRWEGIDEEAKSLASAVLGRCGTDHVPTLALAIDRYAKRRNAQALQDAIDAIRAACSWCKGTGVWMPAYYPGCKACERPIAAVKALMGGPEAARAKVRS
jgi:hypothetical protein